MHTFFINASKQAFSRLDVLTDIYKERKNLVTMKCHIADWYDNKKGYSDCVRNMCSFIDGYAELNNTFNIIFYFDICEINAYSSLERDAHNDRKRAAYVQAAEKIIKAMVLGTVVSELDNGGRKPDSVLLMFGTEKKLTPHGAADNPPSPGDISGKLTELLISDCGNHTKEDRILTAMQHFYAEKRTAFEEFESEPDNNTENDLLINESFDKYIRRYSILQRIATVDCPFNSFAYTSNKAYMAGVQLNIVLHVLKCINEGSVYCDDDRDGIKTVIPYTIYNVEKTADYLSDRLNKYNNLKHDIETLSDTFPELGLAIKLNAFANSRFSLDEFGYKDQLAADRMAVNDNENDEKEKIDPHNLLKADGYVRFYDDKKDASKDAAAALTEHNQTLKKLQKHVLDIFAVYAGKSKSHKEAMLKIGSERYADTSRSTDNSNLESIEEISNRAYLTMYESFMEFCAGRSVEITDIVAQCKWRKKREDQVEESLKNSGRLAAALFAIVTAFYLPYIITQYEEISESALTAVLAVGGIALPLALLTAVYCCAKHAQKNKHHKIEEEFDAQVQKASDSNIVNINAYDEFLAAVIPGLRWVYEYKLDVGYYADCCKVAGAKLSHHLAKLNERVTSIENIISDLECTFTPVPEEGKDSKEGIKTIDLNLPFCTGDKNAALYTVIGDDFWSEYGKEEDI